MEPNNQNGVVNCEPNIEVVAGEIELADMKSIEVDPIRHRVKNIAAVDAQLDKQTSNIQKKSTRGTKSKHAFKCEKCGHVSPDRWKFNRHLQTHEDIKAFKCKDCDFACQRKDEP